MIAVLKGAVELPPARQVLYNGVTFSWAWKHGCSHAKLNKIRSFSLALCAGVAIAASAPASAQRVGHFGGWHGGYGGWHGGYGWRGGFWGPWGWGWGGLGLGLYFATLPYYYTTYWWGGVPYYYADNTYYRWNAGVGQY